MRIAYKTIRHGYDKELKDYFETIYHVIEVNDKAVEFIIETNTVRFKLSEPGDDAVFVYEYIVNDLQNSFNQMLKEGYIDLTDCDLNRLRQHVKSTRTFYLVEDKKHVKNSFKYDDDPFEFFDEE